MYPFPMQDIASLRMQEFRAAAERASLVSQAKAARRADGRPPMPGRMRRSFGWWLVGAGLRLALHPDAQWPAGVRLEATGATLFPGWLTDVPGGRRPDGDPAGVS